LRAARTGVSLKQAMKTQAFASPHATGLGLDIYIPAQDESEVDVAPSQRGQPGGADANEDYGSATKGKQKQTKGFKWMKEHSHKYGFTPLVGVDEPWHWECLIPIGAWKTGEAVGDNYDITAYAIRVEETSNANGSRTSNRNFTFE